MIKTILILSVFLIGVVTISYSLQPAYADTVAWTGAGGDNLWSNGNNWSTGVVPQSTDIIFIYSTSGNAFTVHLDINFQVLADGSINILSDDTLVIDSGTTLTLNGGTVYLGTIINNGKIIASNADGVGIYGGVIGKLTNSPGAIITIANIILCISPLLFILKFYLLYDFIFAPYFFFQFSCNLLALSLSEESLANHSLHHQVGLFFPPNPLGTELPDLLDPEHCSRQVSSFSSPLNSLDHSLKIWHHRFFSS